MAGEKQAKLNLIITARDDAKAVVDQFAKNLKESFDGISQTAREAFGPNITSAFEEMTKVISEGMSSMTSSTSESAKAFEDSMKQMAESAKTTQESVSGSFKEIEGGMKTAGETTSNTHSSLMGGMADLQMAGDTLKGTGESIVGFFEKSAESYIGFDQSIHNTMASLRVSDDTMKDVGKTQQQLSNLALQLGSDGLYSANQIADSMNTLAAQGVHANDIMSGVIQTTKNVAAANNADISKTANVISDIYHEMGDSMVAAKMKSKEFTDQVKAGMSDADKHSLAMKLVMDDVGNSMTGALHSGKMSMDDFMNTMKYVGPLASQAGWSIQQTSAATALFAEHGIKGSQAGTTLRRMLTNMLPQSKAASEWMQKLGLSVDQTSSMFFNADGTAKDFAEAQQTLHEATKNLTPEMQQQAEKAIFGQYALAGMTIVARTNGDEMNRLTKQMSNTNNVSDALAEKQAGLGQQVQAVRAHFETLQKKIGEDLAPVINGLISTLQNLMGWWDQLGKTNPNLQKTIETFALVAGVALVVVGGIMAVIGAIGMFSTMFTAGMAVVGPAIAPVLATIGAVIAIGFLLYEAWTHNFAGIKQIVATSWAWIKQQFQAAMAVIVPVIQQGVQTVVKWWDQIYPKFEQAVKNIIAFIEWLKPLWQAAWNIIVAVLKVAWDLIVGVVKDAWEVLTAVFQFFVDLFTGNWKGVWNDVKQFFGAIWDAICQAFRAIIGVFVGIAVALWDAIKAPFIDAGDWISTECSKIWNNISSWFSGLPDQMSQWGHNMMTMFINSITGGISDLENTLSGVADKIKSFLGFHSPTKEGPASESDVWMPNMMKMFSKGIQQHKHEIEGAVAEVATSLQVGMTQTNMNVSQLNVPLPAATSNNAQKGDTHVHIKIDGRSYKTDNELAEAIATKFRQQINVVSS